MGMAAGAKVLLLATALAAAAALVVVFRSADEVDGDVPAPATPADVVPAGPAAAPAPAPPTLRAERRRDEAAKTAAAVLGDFRLAGQVIDDEEHPVGAAVVKAIRAGALVDEVKTDGAGRFSVRCGRRPAAGSVDVGVAVTFGPSRAAYESFELMEDSPDGEDLGQLQLEAAVPLTARIVDASGPVAGARVFLGSFFGTIFATATADAKGVAHFDTSPATDAWLFAYAPGHGRARGEIPDGRDPKVPLVLTLTARSLRVSVVSMPAGVPLAGARIEARLSTETDKVRLYSSFVPPLELPETGDTGTIVVDDLGVEDAVELRRADSAAAREPWRAAGPRSAPVVAGPREIEARLDVPSGQTLKWRVVPGDAVQPGEGAVVELGRGAFGQLPSGPKALHVEEGFLVGHGFSDGYLSGVAVAADGAIARITTGSDARFMKPRTIDVSVCDAGGAPIAGVAVSLRNAGANTIGEPVRTGDDGRARFTGIEAGLGVLDILAKTDVPPDVRWVAAVDPARGDANVAVKLPRTQQIVLQVTTDGERRLPASWRLLVNQVLETDAVVDGAADLRFTARQRAEGEPIHVVLRSEGYTDAAVDVPPGPSGEPATVPVALVHGIALWAEYRAPSAAGRGGIPVNAVLQQWMPESRAWIEWRDRPYLGSTRRAEPDGRFRFDGVPPGRYRLAAFVAGVSGDPVDVAAGIEPPPVRLDLSRGGLVRVRIVGPDDQPVAGAWVGGEGAAAIGLPPAAFGRGADGSETGVMSVFVPGDRAVRLVARHALLRPDPEKGAVEVTEPGGEVTLKLIDGPVLVFSRPRALQPGGELWAAQVRAMQMRTPAERAWSWLQLFSGPAEGEAVAALGPVSDGGRERAGGFAPGRYTVWIRLPGSAPIVLTDVDARDGVTDLGELRPRRGSAVRVRFAVPEGQSAQRVTVSVTRIDPPRYGSTVQSNGESEVEVPGLGPGRFDVLVERAGRTGETLLRRTVDVDGEHDVVIDSSPR